MNYNKKTVKDIDVAGKKVLLRCDFNVPQDKATGAITDDKRIVAALPTIQYLLDNNAAVIACSHMGKPKGEVKPELSLKPVAARLSELLGKPVIMAGGLGPDNVAEAIEQCKPYGVDSLTKTSIKYDGGYMEKDIDKVRQFCINADAAAAKIGQ